MNIRNIITMAVSASCLLPFASGLTEEYSIPENLEVNRKALKVTIQMSDKTVCRAEANVSSPHFGGYRIMSPKVNKIDGVNPSEIVVDVPDSCVVFADSIYEAFPDSKSFDDIQIRLTTGHEETHKYDINRHPIVGINGVVKRLAAKHQLSQQNLNKLYADISDCTEGRAVFNMILSYAAYLKNCKDKNQQDAYHKVRMKVNEKVKYEGLPLNVADLKDNKHILSVAYHTIVNRYGDVKVRQSGTRYVDALHGYYGSNPEKYAAETFLDVNGQFKFNTNVDYVTPETIAQIDAKCDKMDALCKEYKKEALQILQKSQGDPLIAFHNSKNTFELGFELFVLHPCHLVEILRRVQDRDSAEAVSAASDALLPQWLDHFNAIKAKSDAAPALSFEEAMVFMQKALPLGNKTFQQGLMPEFARLRRVNYYNNTSLKDYVLKSENALIALSQELRESARKGAKEFLGQ